LGAERIWSVIRHWANTSANEGVLKLSFNFDSTFGKQGGKGADGG